MDEVKDKRLKGWSWFDNGVIDHFGPLVGAYAIAVYMALVRHSDADTQTCYPSYEALAKELKISRATVKRAVITLIDYGLIRKRARWKSVGYPDSNLYTLVNTWGGVYRTLPTITANTDISADHDEVGSIGTGVGSIGTGGVGSYRPNNKKENTNTTTPPIVPLKKRPDRQATPKHPFPDGYTPSQSLSVDLEAKFPGVNVVLQVEKMRTWAQSNGAWKSDWNATLRGFCQTDWERRGSPKASKRISPKSGEKAPDGTTYGET